jgi:PPOX class probable F420-dependent enzyme
MDETHLKTLSGQRNAWLTTYRSNGVPVTWQVTVLVKDGHIYFRSYAASRKVRHINQNPEVAFAPSSPEGEVVGPVIRAKARPLTGTAAFRAWWAFVAKEPIRQGVLVPLAHLFNRHKSVHFEFVPDRG